MEWPHWEGCERGKKKSTLGSVPCFCQRGSNLHPLGWAVWGLKNAAVDPVKADPVVFFWERVLDVHGLRLGNAERVWKEKGSREGLGVALRPKLVNRVLAFQLLNQVGL